MIGDFSFYTLGFVLMAVWAVVVVISAIEDRKDKKGRDEDYDNED